MKTKLLLIALLTIGLNAVQAQGQATVYAKNSDISDNLDLRAVASIFGESANLQDFERRLNDPKYQISNLDLNNDDQVDYLRVIESVEDRTHLVIIQAVLDQDVYQDIATIDVERDRYNKVSVQVVGNTYLYGANYIYEPVYNVVPVIYGSFWVTNYRPYYSSWAWNYYPTYYNAWRPYPIYRYRSNINICINLHNRYNYVNYRSSSRAPILYESRRSYGYESRRPNYSFSQRHANISNRYDLDQRRTASREYNRPSSRDFNTASNRNQNTYNNNNYNNNRYNSGRTTSTENRTPNRDYADNRLNTDRGYNTNRTSGANRDNSASVSNPVRVENTQRTATRRDYNSNSSRENSAPVNNSARPEYTQRTESRRDYSQNNASVSRGNSENNGNNNRGYAPQRAETSRNYSQNNANNSRPQNTQRAEPQRASQEVRGNQGGRENNGNERGAGRRI